MKKNTLSDISIIELPIFKDEKKGVLIAMDSENFPFEIRRIFQIIAPTGAIRGEHSHRKHSQIMICTRGVIEIECDDGVSKKNYTLSNPHKGILVPSNIWSKQTYTTDESILTVVCDAKYDENEYIRDYQIFLKDRNFTN
tara:strand:+ start:45 stop:464 length:420 start_codon:yes stop_codon:yes gene_type:complete